MNNIASFNFEKYTKEELRDLFKAYRKVLGLKQNKIADLLGLSHEHICRLESGKKEVTKMQIICMEYFLILKEKGLLEND